MEGFKRALEQLRDLAVKDPSDFAAALQKLLVSDFDATFPYLKTQKLVFRRRSHAWICGLELEMSGWLSRAPLKGKQKAQLSRHLAVCGSIQELLEFIDRQSAALRIWQASTKDLLRSLFAYVEELRYNQESRTSDRKFQPPDQLSALKGSELLRMEIRTYCDYVARIVNQVSGNGVRETGDFEPSPSDLRDALAVAAQDDIILHVLDCYTYKNFRVSVDGRNLKMHALRSGFEEAITWSSRRESSGDILEARELVTIMKKVESVARMQPCESESFRQFLESEPGRQLLQASRPVREECIRTLKRDVIDQIDLDLALTTRSGAFRAQELLEGWSFLFQLAFCARMWCRIYRKESVAVLPVPQLVSLFVASLGCTIERAERLVSQFSLNPSERNQDPFFRPLICLDAGERLIAGTFIETGRFSRNLFTIAIREGRVNFSAKGLKPLRDIYQKFLRAGYRAALNFPMRTGEKLLTDVDIAAAKDGFLFVGQTKVLIRPDTVYDGWKVLENLRRAADQLRTSLQHISSLCDRLGVVEGEVVVVPFLLTNVWDYTGALVGGFKVVDFSYLSLLLTGGEIWRVQFEPVARREVRKLIRGRYPTGEELARLLLKPIHEAMFEQPELKTHPIAVGDWTISVPVDMRRLPGNDADRFDRYLTE